MTPRHRLAEMARRYAPCAVLWRSEAADHAETRKALAVSEHDLAAHAAHFALACAHRDAALVLLMRQAVAIAEDLRSQLSSVLEVQVFGDAEAQE